MLKMIRFILFFLVFFLMGFYNNVFAQISIENVFSDISKDYIYYDELQTLYDKGMISSDSSGKFNPQRLLNRDEFVGISMEVTCKKCISPNTDFSLIEKYSTALTFYDVLKSNKYFYCIAEADEKGYVKGYDKGYTCENNEVDNDKKPFCVDNKITLEEALAVILRNSGIFTVAQNRTIIEQINAGKITKKLADDISPTGVDGGAYTFYGYFKEALDFELLEYNEKGEQKIYKLLELTDNKARPGQSISKEDFLIIAYIALKANSCIDEQTNELAVNIDKFNKTCNINGKKCDNRDFSLNENTFDFSADVAGICSQGIDEESGYTWKFYNIDTGREVIIKGKYLDDYTFIEAGKWRVSLFVVDDCGNIGNVYLTNIIQGDNKTRDDLEDFLGLQIKTGPLKGSMSTQREFECMVTGGNGDYSCSWDFGNGSTGNGIVTNYTYTKSGTYVVTVTASDSDGKTTTSTVVVIATIDGKTEIENDDLKSLAADIKASPKYSKIGTDIKFEALAAGGTGKYRYLWDYGDSKKGAGKNSSHKYEKSGQYFTKLTIIDSKLNRATSTVAIVVLEEDGMNEANGLGVDISATPLEGDIDTVRKFNALAEGGDGNYTYEWNFGDNYSSTNSAIDHTYESPGTYTVTLNVTDGLGNKGVSTVEIVVTEKESINDVYSLGVNIIASPLEGNVNTLRKFNALVEGGEGSYTYKRDFGDNSHSNKLEETHIYGTPGSYTTTLTVIDGKGNKGIDTVIILSTDNDGIDTTNSLGVDMNITPFKGGTDVMREFEAIIEGGNGEYTYEWDFGDDSAKTSKSVGKNTSHLYNNAGTYTVRLTVTDGEGNSKNLEKKVTVQSTEGGGDMTLNINVKPSTSLFLGEEFSFISNVSGGDGEYAYEWVFGDGELSEYKNAEHSYSDAKGYNVILEVKDGSGKSVKTNVVVAVNKTEELLGGISVDMTRTPSKLNIGGSVQFDSTVIHGGPNYYYEWTFGDGSISTLADPQHIFNTIGTHTVTLVVRDDLNRTGQKTTSIIVVSDTICIEGTDFDEDGVTDCDNNDKCPLIPGSLLNEGCPTLERACNNDCSCPNGYECSSKDILQCGTIGLCKPQRIIFNACLEYGQTSLIYGNVTNCNSCPCSQSLDFNSNLRKCDTIFPAITSKDHTEIYSRGQIFNIK